MSREELVEKLGISALTDEAQDEIIQKHADAVTTRIFNKLSEQLSEEDYAKLDTLMEADDAKGVETVLKGKVENYDQWALQIETDMLNEYQNNSDAIDAIVAAAEVTKTPLD